MGIENGRVLGTESVRVRALPRGGSGATGVGQRAGSAEAVRSVDPPRPQRRSVAFPPGITMEGATAPEGG